MLAFVFPGQGSQAKGMGNSLFEEFPEYVAQADKILGYSLKTLCMEDPENKLNLTQYTQPALFVVNALCYFRKINSSKQKPDYVAGHSLGEYNALLAAEVFDFATGVQLVQKRGELMSQASEGAMAAIIGLRSEQIEQLLLENKFSEITVANYNSYTQTVISGPKLEIERCAEIFNNISSVNFIQLKVSGAFHSKQMAFVQQQFIEYLQQLEFAVPKIPVIANINAIPYHPNVTIENLSEQIVGAVRWTKTIEYLLSRDKLMIEEVGPGNVLKGLLKRIEIFQ